MSHVAAVLSLGMVAFPTSAVGASEFGYVSQEREVSAWVSVFECFEDASDQASAPDFDPFEDTATAVIDCGTDAGTAEAIQNSVLGPTSIAASGSARSTTLMSAFNFLIAECWSDVLVDVTLAEPTRLSLSGVLTSVATADIDDAGFWVTAQVELLAGAVVEIEHEVTAVANEGPATLPINEVRILEAGLYTVHIEAFSSYADAVVVTGESMSTYDLAIGAFDLADIDLDGAVGFADLLALLAHWGACPPGPCAADLTGDGAVSFDDLVILLARWG